MSLTFCRNCGKEIDDRILPDEYVKLRNDSVIFCKECEERFKNYEIPPITKESLETMCKLLEKL